MQYRVELVSGKAWIVTDVGQQRTDFSKTLFVLRTSLASFKSETFELVSHLHRFDSGRSDAFVLKTENSSASRVFEAIVHFRAEGAKSRINALLGNGVAGGKVGGGQE